MFGPNVIQGDAPVACLGTLPLEELRTIYT